MIATDVLIVGQGLAGSTLAWALHARGVSSFVVDRGGVDDHGRSSASRVAAGLITPITGKRLTLDPNWEPLRAAAVALYREAEEKTGASLLTEAASLRVFASADERSQFDRRVDDDQDYARQVRMAAPEAIPAGVPSDYRAFWMTSAARLDVPAFIGATRQWLIQEGGYCKADVDFSADIELTPTGVVLSKLNRKAKCVVLCQGFTTSRFPSAVAPTIVPVKGELLRVAAPALQLESVVHQGMWIAPCLGSRRGEYLVGATNEPGCSDARPSASARSDLLAGLRRLHQGDATVIDHQAGVRPATHDRRPIARVSEGDARIAWFNGLGAKGALLAPHLAERLADDLKRRLAS